MDGRNPGDRPFLFGNGLDALRGGERQNRLFFGKVKGKIKNPGELILCRPEGGKLGQGSFFHPHKYRVVIFYSVRMIFRLQY